MIAARLVERLGAPSYREHIDSFDAEVASSRLDGYRGPLAFIAGRSDGLVTPDVVDASARAHPGSEIRWIDACGHYPHREQPAQLVAHMAELTEAFLAPSGCARLASGAAG
jgi:pimeloyl-ACP methyl ester carboxylesterase